MGCLTVFAGIYYVTLYQLFDGVHLSVPIVGCFLPLIELQYLCVVSLRMPRGIVT